MLHAHDLGRFPYRGVLSEAIAVSYAKRNGLAVTINPTSGFISRTDAWVRYRCERPNWQRFTQVQFGRPRERSRSRPLSSRRAHVHERSRSRGREQRVARFLNR